MKTIISIISALLLAFAVEAQVPFPTNLVVRLNTNGQVSLAWDRAASHTNLASFGILVGVRSGVYNVRHEVTTNNTVYTVTNLPAGVTFYFAAVARNVAGIDSDPSNEVSYTIPKPEPVPAIRTTYIDSDLESAPFPTGPWTNEVSYPRFSYLATSEQKFFRVRMRASPGPLVRN